MANPFAFKYPPALVEWFGALIEEVRAHSPAIAERFQPTLNLLQTGERVKEGMARSITFKVREGASVGKRIALSFGYDGISFAETLDNRNDSASVSDCSANGANRLGVSVSNAYFQWKNIGCGVSQCFIQGGNECCDEIRASRRVCDLEACLSRLSGFSLAAADCEVLEVCVFQVVRNASELERVLSDRFANHRSCLLMSRDGAVRVEVSSGPCPASKEKCVIKVRDDVTGGEATYPTLSSLLATIPPGIFSKGLRYYPVSSAGGECRSCQSVMSLIPLSAS